jgi:hypothetical protein
MCPETNWGTDGIWNGTAGQILIHFLWACLMGCDQLNGENTMKKLECPGIDHWHGETYGVERGMAKRLSG